jgi:hypothetical protein
MAEEGPRLDVKLVKLGHQNRPTQFSVVVDQRSLDPHAAGIWNSCYLQEQQELIAFPFLWTALAIVTISRLSCSVETARCPRMHLVR